jgi:exonuclease SbcD
MKFAHMADCHIGSWRDPRLNDVSVKAFEKAIDLCIARKVDFILIAGDLFNTSLPQIDKLKTVVLKLKKLKDKDIPVYLIAGSHDFSPSGKTILDVLENAGLCINVVKGDVHDEKLRLHFTVDEKTGAKITGMLGKKGMLEKSFYESLDRNPLEKEDGYKIFMLHTALSELKPKDLEQMDSTPLSYLPKNFDYYAAGHVHDVMKKAIDGYGLVAYPGALFPDNFKELEKYGKGGLYFVSVKDGKTTADWEPIQIYNTCNITLDCAHKTPEEINSELMAALEKKEFIHTIVTIRLEGKLSAGKPSDINLKDVFEKLYEKSAHFVMKNTAKLTAEGLEEIKVDTANIDDTEEKLITEHLGQIKVDGLTTAKEAKLAKDLMKIFGTEKQEGERAVEYEDKISKEAAEILGFSQTQ